MSVVIIHSREHDQNSVAAFDFNTNTKNAIHAFMTSIGYRTWEYTIHEDMSTDSLIDDKVWFKHVDIQFGEATIKIDT